MKKYFEINRVFFLFIKRIRFISLLSSLLIEDYFEFKLKKNCFLGKILSDYDFTFFEHKLVKLFIETMSIEVIIIIIFFSKKVRRVPYWKSKCSTRLFPAKTSIASMIRKFLMVANVTQRNN
jgi:hypothetical protein